MDNSLNEAIIFKKKERGGKIGGESFMFRTGFSHGGNLIEVPSVATI